MSDTVQDKDQVSNEVPQYRLTEQAYIGDKLLEVGAVIEYKGIPGHHMEPINPAAKAAKKKAPSYLDPILAMTSVN